MTAEQLKASLITYAMKGGLSASWRKEHNYSFELWRNLPLSKICHTMTYGTARKSSSEGDVVVIRMGNLQGGEIIWSKLAYTTDRDDIEKYLLTPGDILFNRTNSPELVGKTSIYRGERPAIYAGYLIRLDYDKNIIIGEYLNYVMNSQEERQFCADVRVNGVCQANINAKKIGAFSIPVPPIDEQQYIVSCLNELLPIVEEYGKSQKALHVLETELSGKLRASLLQQAIMGKLVPQLEDEPAVDIDSEELEDVPFAIPEKWKWVKIKNLVTPCEQKIPDRDFLYIDVSSIDNTHHKIRPALKILQPHEAPSRARKIVKQGMVLYSTVRPYLLNTCIVDTQMHDEMICSTAFVAVTCSDKLISSYFLSFLLSPCFISYVLSVQKGVAYPAITDKHFYDAIIPLPPLDEQRRIVARINELFLLFDTMIKY